ncbi:MAG: L-rhamnose isomerase [Pirellulaceae bacterium]
MPCTANSRSTSSATKSKSNISNPGSTGQANKTFVSISTPATLHPKADDGYTLAHADAGIRRFWIDHGIACRKIAAAMGAAQGNPCINNVWVPDGSKDTPASRKAPREQLGRCSRCGVPAGLRP